MKNNRFGVLTTGEEVDNEFQTVQAKTKKEKPARKTSQEDNKPKIVRPVNVNVPTVDTKEDNRQRKYDRDQRPQKGVQDHRLHDRQSANNKPSEARKQGGGAGNIGNMRDEMNQDKILAKVKEDGTEEVVEEAPKEPEKPTLTLDEYYQQQGINVPARVQKEDKTKKRNEPVQAEWIAKERLTLMKTKEDSKVEEERKPNVIKTNDHRVQAQPEVELLGFKSALSAGEQKKPREEKDKPTKSGKSENRKNKPIINEEDFPSL